MAICWCRKVVDQSSGLIMENLHRTVIIRTFMAGIWHRAEIIWFMRQEHIMEHMVLQREMLLTFAS